MRRRRGWLGLLQGIAVVSGSDLGCGPRSGPEGQPGCLLRGIRVSTPWIRQLCAGLPLFVRSCMESTGGVGACESCE